MSKLTKKYKRDEKDLIESMTSRGKTIFVISITLKETSKLKEHQIYECIYVDGGQKKETNIIAKDITDGMEKLKNYVGFGIPAVTTNHILGNEKYNDDNL